MLMKWIATLLKLATPEIVEAVKKAARELRDKAKVTDNPVDDILTGLLCLLVNADD